MDVEQIGFETKRFSHTLAAVVAAPNPTCRVENWMLLPSAANAERVCV